MEYKIERNCEYQNALAYLEKPKILRSPFYHKELTKSLEAATSNSKSADKPKNTLENMISDKAKSLKASVNAILEEIDLREGLNKYQFEKINGELRRQRTRLMGYESLKYEFQSLIALPRTVLEAKSQVEANVLELEKEKRKEGLECWRDLMFLKKYLMVSLRDYWELVRRRGALEKR